ADVFSWYNPTDDFVVKFKTSTFIIWFKFNPNMTILPTSAGLTNEFTFNLSCFAECFTVCHLRVTNISFYFKLHFQSINDNIEMKLSHTGDDRLTGFFVCFGLESRILFS